MSQVPEGCVALFGTVEDLRRAGLPPTVLLTDGEMAYALFRVPPDFTADESKSRAHGLLVLEAGAHLPDGRPDERE